MHVCAYIYQFIVISHLNIVHYPRLCQIPQLYHVLHSLNTRLVHGSDAILILPGVDPMFLCKIANRIHFKNAYADIKSAQKRRRKSVVVDLKGSF